MFDSCLPEKEASTGLFNTTQGTRSVTNYAIGYQTYAADSKWNKLVFSDAFNQRLADQVKEELVVHDLLGL